MEPGTYTYEVRITQTDVNEPGLIAYDECTYRSKYLQILRAADTEGNAIFDAEYDGYDDNSTPEDDTDDNYIYIIRHYVLQDSKDAHQGELQLYDPDLNLKVTWNIAGRECINHSSADGLHADATGIHHALRVRVPVSYFDGQATLNDLFSLPPYSHTPLSGGQVSVCGERGLPAAVSGDEAHGFFAAADGGGEVTEVEPVDRLYLGDLT